MWQLGLIWTGVSASQTEVVSKLEMGPAIREWALSIGREFAFQWFGEHLDNLHGLMPAGMGDSVAGLLPYMRAANYWMPLAEALGLAAVYLMIWASFVTIKMILKMIPTIG